MSSVNRGNQYITYDYKHPARGRDFNTLLCGGIVPGIYEGGTLTKINDTTVSLSPFIAYVRCMVDGLRTVRIQTFEAINDITISSASPLICLSYTWDNQIEIWADFSNKSLSATLTYEIPIGRGVFSGTTLNSFDYTYPYKHSPYQLNSPNILSSININKISADTTGAIIQTYKARGTTLVPSAVQSGDNLSSWNIIGHAATGKSSTRAAIQAYAAETWTDSANGTYIRFLTTPTSSTSLTEVLRLGAATNIGMPTLETDAKLAIQNTSFLNTSIIRNTSTTGVKKGLGVIISGAGTTNTGIDIALTADATNNRALVINSIAAAANNYAIYSAALAKSYFAGSIGINATVPRSNLDVNGIITAGTGTIGYNLFEGYSSTTKFLNIGLQYSTGAIYIGHGIKSSTTAASYVSSHAAASGRSVIDLNGSNIGFWTGPSQTSTDGGSLITWQQKLSIDANGRSVFSFYRGYTAADSTATTGAQFRGTYAIASPYIGSSFYYGLCVDNLRTAYQTYNTTDGNAITDAGTLDTLIGQRILTGHSNTITATPITANIMGLYVQTYLQQGSITGNVYDVYLTSPSTGTGTLSGKYYSIYQAYSSARNWFSGATIFRSNNPGDNDLLRDSTARVEIYGTITAGTDLTSGNILLQGITGVGYKSFILGTLYNSGAGFQGFGVKSSSSVANGYVSSRGIATSGRSAIETNNGFIRFWTGATEIAGEDSTLTNFAERVRIIETGYMGLNRTAPTQRLDVNGNIKMTDWIISQDANGSIVFST